MQKQSNLRMTRQRQVILEEVRKIKTHPSADEVYEIVRKRLPRISLGTVYRNLEMLTETGDIQKLEAGGSPKRFDGNPDDHYHARCIRCDRIVDAHLEIDLKINGELSDETGFKISGHKLEFVGLCPSCADISNPS